MNVSVVTPTRNRQDRLERLLTALERQTVPADRFEVVVSDDGSVDGTRDLLAGYTGPLRLKAVHGENGGPAAARNRGWQATGTPLVLFSDDDVEPADCWLAAMLTAAAQHPGCVLQGKVLPNPAELAQLGPLARSLRIEALSPHFETANILYPRALLEQLGGFDAALTTAGEDTDLGQRALAAGVAAHFVDDAVSYHAVHQRGLRDTLRDSMRATDGVRVYRDHPHLRELLGDRVWYDPSHPLLAQAVGGMVLARRHPSAALMFAGPYALHLARECRRSGAPLSTMPALALRDAVQFGATLRGAARHRTFVL